MHRFFKIALAGVGVAAVAGALAGPAAAQFGGPPNPNLGAPLWAASETEYASKKPILSADLGLGGPGSFTGIYNEAKGQLCYVINAPGLVDPTVAHIHKGAAGENGAPVVPLAAPVGGTSGGCVAVTADVAKAIVANPAGYYVNVHTKAMPGGEVRAQLSVQGEGQKWAAKNI